MAIVARAVTVPVERSTALSTKVSSPLWLGAVSPGTAASTATVPAWRAFSIAARSVSLGLKVT